MINLETYRFDYLKLYCLSGLGVDQKAFKYFTPKGMELIHIPWIKPLKKEGLRAYSIRLFKRVQPEEDYSLIGVSFGGMIASEFAKIQAPKKLYLISTVPSRDALQGFFKFGAKLRLHKLLPTPLLTRANFFTYFLFGIKSIEDKQLIRTILRDTDVTFMKWAIQAIVTWNNKTDVAAIVIHGSKDRILPRKEDVDHLITGGGHFMIVTRGKEITQIIENENQQNESIA
jgi:pimeloyl-ACP methyl ester carboxylesterase